MGILMPFYIIPTVLLYIVLMLIPKKPFADLVKMVFGVEVSIDEDFNKIDIDFHGKRILINSRIGRFKMASILSTMFMIISVVFIEECVISADALAVGELCPDQSKDCFVFDYPMAYSPSKSFECVPGEPVISSNSSGYRAACYKYILNQQKTIDILNQLGICAGLLSLSANILWLLCSIASRLLGLIILIILAIGAFVAIMVLVYTTTPYEVLTLVLITLIILLIGSAIAIVIYGENDDND